MPIIFTQQGVKQDAITAPKSKLAIQKALPCPKVGELGWELMSGLDHTDQDLYITARPSYDAFHETDLHYILKELEVRTAAMYIDPPSGTQNHSIVIPVDKSAPLLFLLLLL